MIRRLAHRPRHHLTRANPRPLRRSNQDYLHQHWTYHQRRISPARRPPGYSLALVPYGWRLARMSVGVQLPI